VDEKDVGIVNGVEGVGRMLARGILFQVDPGEILLLPGEDFVPVLEIVADRLEEDAVQREIPDVFDGDFVDVSRPREIPRTPRVPVRPSRFDREIELVGDMGEVVEIMAVDVPGQNPQGASMDLKRTGWVSGKG
jgi:hypothetical protein